jgi:group II intron reverse transcriptase/maturase
MASRLIEQILAPDNLRAAWEEVASNSGAAGVDDVTISRWRRNWEERLVELAQAVRGNTYTPSPLRRFSRPKRSGGYRHYAIPTVTDRVLQRAVLRVLDDRFERRFLDASYGYRPGRSIADAVRQIVVLRENGYRWVLDADIDECFDSLDNELAMAFFAQEVRDPITRRLVRQWLEVGRRDPDLPKGIPLGSVISPLLCNVYLHRLDLRLTELGYRHVRYADDFCIFCENRNRARRAWADVEEILEDLRLQLEPQKTRIVSFDQGFEYLGVWFERDEYSYRWKDKRIEVKGDFDWMFTDYGPQGYGD